MDAGRDTIVVPVPTHDTTNPSALNDTNTVDPKISAVRAEPRWSVRFVTDPHDDCPAGCAANSTYSLGPTTPQGFCVYAAKAVLDTAISGSGKGQTRCPKCRALIQIDPADPEHR